MKNIVAVLFSVMFFSLSSSAFADDTLLSIGLGFEFATGNYGTDSTTDSITVPFTVRAYPIDRLDLEMIIPYIYQSNGSTTAAGMLRFRNGRSGGSTSARGNGRSPVSAEATGAGSGIGDMTLKAGYTLIKEEEAIPGVTPELFVRFPTGDEQEGLGTGEFTVGTGMEISKWFGDLKVYGEGIYYFQDSSSDLALKDYFGYEAGIGYQVTDRLRPSLLVIGATSPSDYSSAIAELRAKVDFRITGRAGFEGYIATGLTDDSLDFGIGAALFYDL